MSKAKEILEKLNIFNEGSWKSTDSQDYDASLEQEDSNNGTTHFIGFSKPNRFEIYSVDEPDNGVKGKANNYSQFKDLYNKYGYGVIPSEDDYVSLTGK